MTAANLRPILFGSLGAILGAVLGYLLMRALLSQGLYCPALPGAGVGLGFSFASRRGWRVGAVLCGIAGVIVGVLAEWHLMPFAQDTSLVFFIANLTSLPWTKQIFIALGGFFAFWFTWGKTPQPRSNADSASSA